MQTMTAAEFEAKCQEILEDVPQEGLMVTKDGLAVAVIYPGIIDNSDLIGIMPHMEIRGDIFSTGIKWDAQS